MTPRNIRLRIVIIAAAQLMLMVGIAEAAAPAMKSLKRYTSRIARSESSSVALTVLVVDAPPAPVPLEFGLYQNYPNPFNAETRIDYTLPEALHVRLEVYDISGRLVKRLVNETQSTGRHSYLWQYPQGSTGFYLYHLSAGSYEQCRKMLLLK